MHEFVGLHGNVNKLRLGHFVLYLAARKTYVFQLSGFVGNTDLI